MTMAPEQLFAENERLAYWMVGRRLALYPNWIYQLRACGLELADANQVAAMAVWRAAQMFDASRGIKFGTYACRAVWNALVRLAERPGVVGHSTELVEGEAITAPVSYEVRRIDARDEIEWIARTVGGLNGETVARLLDGETAQSLSGVANSDKAHRVVRQRLLRVRQKLGTCDGCN